MNFDKELLMTIQNAIAVMKHYDNGEDLALTTSRNRLLEIEQKLQQHSVSGKQPDYKTIHAAAVEYAQKEWAHANDVDTEKKYSSNDFHAGAQWALSQVACASSGEAQGVCAAWLC